MKYGSENLERELLISWISNKDLVRRCTVKMKMLDGEFSICNRIGTRVMQLYNINYVYCELHGSGHKYPQHMTKDEMVRMPGADFLEVILDHLGLGSDLKPV